MIERQELPLICSMVIPETMERRTSLQFDTDSRSLERFTIRPDLGADGSTENATFVLNPEWPKSPFFDIDPRVCARYSHDELAVVALHAAGISIEGMIAGFGGNAAELVPDINARLGLDDPDRALTHVADAYNNSVLRPFRPLIIDASATEAATLSDLRDTAKQGMQSGFDKASEAYNSLQALREQYGMPTLASTLALANTVQWHDLSTRSLDSIEMTSATQARKEFIANLQEHGVGDTIKYSDGLLHFDYKGDIPAEYERHASLWLMGLSGPEIAKVLGEGHTAFSVQTVLKRIRPKLTHPDVKVTASSLPRSISYAVAKDYVTFPEPVPEPPIKKDLLGAGIMNLLPTGISDVNQHHALSTFAALRETTVEDFRARKKELLHAWQATSQSELLLKLYASGTLSKRHAEIGSHRSAQALNTALSSLT